jgi:hypothetical protein
VRNLHKLGPTGNLGKWIHRAVKRSKRPNILGEVGSAAPEKFWAQNFLSRDRPLF